MLKIFNNRSQVFGTKSLNLITAVLPAEIDTNSLTISFNEFCERIKEQQEGIIVVYKTQVTLVEYYEHV